jgi:hypothetical protein
MMSLRMVDRSYLVEVPMSIEPHDYSPDRVRKCLQRYPEIAAKCSEVKSQRFDPDLPPARSKPEQWRYVNTKRDIDEAIGWLQTMDQRAAELVFLHYVELKDTASLADRFELAQSSIHRIISSGIKEMAWKLGWRESNQVDVESPSTRTAA